MHFYKHNIGEFSAATAGLDFEEIGIFVRLLDRFVLTEKPIKTEWVNLGFKGEAKGKAEAILAALFVEVDGGYVYEPALAWVEEYQSNAEKNRENGKKGGRPKKKNPEKPSGLISVSENNPTERQTLNINHKPLDIDNHIYLSTNNEGIGESGSVDVTSCFRSFGQNPVTAPAQWEPDEDDFDTPLRDQIKRNQKIEVDVNDGSRVLTASEIIVLAATLGYRLTHNIALDEIAEKKVITTGIVKEAVQRTRDNTGGVGYLIRILQNAAKDPDAFNGIRKPPVVTAETITEAQCRSFAYKAVNAGCLAYAGESHQEAIARVEKRLKDPTYFNRNRQTLERLGLIQGAQA